MAAENRHGNEMVARAALTCMLIGVFAFTVPFPANAEESAIATMPPVDSTEMVPATISFSFKRREPLPKPALAEAVAPVDSPSPSAPPLPSLEALMPPAIEANPVAQAAPPIADVQPSAPAVADAATKPLMQVQPPLPVAPSVAGGSDQEGVFFRSLINDGSVLSLDVTGATSAIDIAGPVSMEEAVVLALKNNFEAKASNSKLKSAYWEKVAAYSRYAPALDVKLANGTEESSPSAYNDVFGNRVLNDKHNRRDRTFSIRQPIVDLAVIADIVTSANRQDVAEQEDRDAREGLAYDTVSVYLRLMQARLAVHLSEQYRGYLEDLSARMEARVSGGGATAGDLERIKARAAQAESARIEAVGDYESNLAEFRRLTQVTPAQLKIPEIIVAKIPSDVSLALDGAIQSNPAYLASVLKVEVASSSRDASLAKLAPTVALEYSDTSIYNAGGAAKGNPVDGVYPDQEDKRLMLVAHWTLNGGVEIVEGISNAEKKRQAHYVAQDAKSRIEQSVRTSYNAINAANQRMAVLQQGVDSNSKVVSEFEDQYRNGSRSVFELLDAYEQLYGARLNLMRVSIAKAQASYQVRRQMGDLLQTLVAQRKE